MYVHVPKNPPNVEEIAARIMAGDGKRAAEVMRYAKQVDEKGRYLHWDTLRFRKPPPGLTHEEWWWAVRWSRRFASPQLPLKAANNEPLTYCEPPMIREALRYFDMHAGGHLGARSEAMSQGEGRAHLTRSLAEEPFASSFIEGAATTRQIAKKLILEGREPRTRDELMVLNNFRGLQFVKQNKDEPLTVDMICEIHRIITQGTLEEDGDAGRVRTGDDIQVVDDTTGEVLHQPPPAAELERRLQGLVDFANDGGGKDQWLHPLLRAILLHFMLAYEHPFVDGNGRVARALFYWSALRSGYWLLEYVSISSVIAEAKIKYGQAFLEVETDAMDTTYFAVHQIEVLRAALDRFSKYMERKSSEVRTLARALEARRGRHAFNHRQAWLLNEFARGRQVRMTIAEHEQKHGVSYLTARADLERLTERKLLRKTKRAQTSIYTPVPNLADKLTAGA